MITNKRKRKKRGIKLLVAYALRTVVVLIPLFCIFLMICGCLYIRDCFRMSSADDKSSISYQQEELSGLDTTGDIVGGIIPVPPAAGDTPVVVLDAGHGGIQSGCEFEGVLEKDITLSVSLRLKTKLEAMGITVVLTRGSDEHISLSERTEIANAANADCFISIHCNSYTEDTSISGLEGYYYQSEEAKRLADCILNAAEIYSVAARNTKEENFQVLRETNIPATLLEIGFLSNTAERQALLNEDYQDVISSAIADGIAVWLNI